MPFRLSSRRRRKPGHGSSAGLCPVASRPSVKPFIPKRFETAAFALLLSGIMSFFVSGLSTVSALGMGDGLLPAWMAAWAKSWLFAFPVVFVVAPMVRRLLRKLVVDAQ